MTTLVLLTALVGCASRMDDRADVRSTPSTSPTSDLSQDPVKAPEIEHETLEVLAIPSPRRDPVGSAELWMSNGQGSFADVSLQMYPFESASTEDLVFLCPGAVDLPRVADDAELLLAQIRGSVNYPTVDGRVPPSTLASSLSLQGITLTSLPRIKEGDFFLCGGIDGDVDDSPIRLPGSKTHDSNEGFRIVIGTLQNPEATQPSAAELVLPALELEMRGMTSCTVTPHGALRSPNGCRLDAAPSAEN